MKRLLAHLYLAALILMPSVLPAQDLLNGTESIDCDYARNRWLVTSYFADAVVAIADDGTQSYFYTDSDGVLCLHIDGNTLYVTNHYGLKGVDLETGIVVLDMLIPALNNLQGMTTDNDGFLYVVDTGGRVLKVDPSVQTYSVLVGSGLPLSPQDIAYDPIYERLLLASYQAGSRVTAINPGDGAMWPAINESMGYYDGISVDNDGHVYLSSHLGPGYILGWNGDAFSSCEVISTGHIEPAGNCYNEQDGVLAIANWGSSTVDFLLLDQDVDGVPKPWDNCLFIYNPEQLDSDTDGEGDLCDLCTDTDDDGYGNPGFPDSTCPSDNCPDSPNPDQSDFDSDGVGNECDNCLFVYNPGQEDADQNQIGDACESCCQGRVGDANGLGGDEPTIGDVSTVIDALFIGSDFSAIYCLAEADINQSGGAEPTCDDVTIGDISVLIDYLFITGPSLGLPDCR